MREEKLISVTWRKIRQRVSYYVCQQANDKPLRVHKCATEGTVRYRGSIFVTMMSVWKESICGETYENYVIFRNNV